MGLYSAYLVSFYDTLAAQRIAGRTGGNSRFDGQDAATTAQRLENLEGVYIKLVNLFREKTGMKVCSLDGETDLKANAARIEALAKQT